MENVLETAPNAELTEGLGHEHVATEAHEPLGLVTLDAPALEMKSKAAWRGAIRQAAQADG